MIALINYGAGNTASVSNVLKELKAEFILSDKIEEISVADKIILPGVGEASSAMNKLRELGLVDTLIKTTKPVLGICLGMQLLCRYTEEGDTNCFEVIPVDVKKFNNEKIKVPHIGWNQVSQLNGNKLFNSINDNDYFYFAHSFYVPLNEFTISICNYGIDFSASVKYKNFYGVQFHPEKSAQQGIRIIKNFLEL
jgi:imidazole glycerol-phosphate synthase subunit HisH